MLTAVAGFEAAGEVVGDAEGDELGVHAAGRIEVEPLPELVVGAEVDAVGDAGVGAAGYEVVGQVGERVVVVVDPAAVHAASVGGEAAVVAEIAFAELIGALVGLVVVGGVDLVEAELDAPAGARVEVDVDGAATEVGAGSGGGDGGGL